MSQELFSTRSLFLHFPYRHRALVSSRPSESSPPASPVHGHLFVPRGGSQLQPTRKTTTLETRLNQPAHAQHRPRSAAVVAPALLALRGVWLKAPIFPKYAADTTGGVLWKMHFQSVAFLSSVHKKNKRSLNDFICPTTTPVFLALLVLSPPFLSCPIRTWEFLFSYRRSAASCSRTGLFRVFFAHSVRVQRRSRMRGQGQKHVGEAQVRRRPFPQTLQNENFLLISTVLYSQIALSSSSVESMESLEEGGMTSSSPSHVYYFLPSEPAS